MPLCWHPCLPTMYTSPLQGCGVSIYLCRDAFLRLGKPAGLHQQRFSRRLACGDARMRLYNVCLLCSFAGILACRRCTHRRYRVVGLQSVFVETHSCVSASKEGTPGRVTPLTPATRGLALAFAPAVPARLARLRLPSLHIPRRWRLPALPPCGLLAAGG